MSELFSSDDRACNEFLACKHQPAELATRTFLEDAWKKFGDFVGDEHFLTEFRSQFPARSWEIYLLAVLSDAGLQLQPAGAKGPDICAKIGDQRVWIEAVVPTPGTSEDRVFQRPQGPKEKKWHGGLYSEDSLLLRYRSVIGDKLEKIDGYIRQDIVKPKDIVLIALNQSSIRDSDLHDNEVPAMLKAVLPLGEPVIASNGTSEAHVTIPPRFAITKQNSAEVSTTLFLEKRSASIAGALFAAQNVWNLRKTTETDLGLVHNPQASAAFPRNKIPWKCEFWVENGYLQATYPCSRSQ
jgi:hypothetical protein